MSDINSLTQWTAAAVDAKRLPGSTQRACPFRAWDPVGLTTYDAKDPETRFPPIRDIRPAKGAPNVLVILLDDVGFGASSAFGGPVNTPTAERLAEKGLKLNRFHTTALCSPTRTMSRPPDGSEPGMGEGTEEGSIPGGSKPPLTWLEAVALLDTIPGVNQRTAEKMLAEMGLDMSRFPTAGHLATWWFLGRSLRGLRFFRVGSYTAGNR